VRRVEVEELAELVDREDQRFGGPFTEVRVADSKLGIGTIRALRVGLGDLLEELARGQPFFLVEGVGALVEQELVRLGRARRHETARCGGAAGGDSDECRAREHRQTGREAGSGHDVCERSRSACQVSESQRYSGRESVLETDPRREAELGSGALRVRRRCDACPLFDSASWATIGGRSDTRAIMSSTLVHGHARTASNIVYIGPEHLEPPPPRSLDRIGHEREVAGSARRHRIQYRLTTHCGAQEFVETHVPDAAAVRRP